MIGLINEFEHWIGLDVKKGTITAMDYAAGTGLWVRVLHDPYCRNYGELADIRVEQALAPHAGGILLSTIQAVL